MAESVIGSLRVVLGLDTATFSDGLKKASGDLDKFSGGFKVAAAALVGIAAGVAGGLIVATKSAIDLADQLNKASQKFGVPVEELSKLKFAADLADVSFESLGKGLGKLSKALTDAAANPSGQAAKAFAAIGVSARDAGGNVKSSEAAMLDIADAFAGLKDGAGKTAIAYALFGRAGAELIPLLNQGKSGITALKDEAAKLGIVISQETAAKAEEFNDTLKRLQTGSEALGLKIASALLDPLQKLASAFLTGSREGGFFENVIKNLVTEVDIQTVQRIVVAFQNLANILGAFKQAAQLFSVGEFTAGFKALDDAIAANVNRLKELQNSFLSLGKAGAFDSLEGLPTILDKISKGQKDINFGALSNKNALESFIESQKKSIAGMEAEAQTVGLLTGAREKLKIQLEGEQIALSNHIPLTDAVRAKLDALGESARIAAIKLNVSQAIEDALPEYEKLSQKVKQIQADMDAFPAKAAALGPALLKAQIALQNNLLAASSTALGQISELFNTLGAKNKEAFQVGKAFAIAQATINTYQAATKALAEFGWPLGAVFAAAAVAAGIANVIKIQQTQFKGAALGGSFMVPGGTSGFDSKLIPMRLSPGERVDVTPANRAGGGSRELIIPSIKPKDFFTGDVVREMVFSIDQWIKDGGTGIRMATR